MFIISSCLRKRKRTAASSITAHTLTARSSTPHAKTIFQIAANPNSGAINGPKLRAAGKIGLQIIEIVETIETNREDCLYLVNLIAQILQPLGVTLESRTSEELEAGLRNDLEQFIGDLESIRDDLEAVSDNSIAAGDGEVIMRCKGIVEQSFKRFRTYIAVPSRMDVVQADSNQLPTTVHNFSISNVGGGRLYNAGRDQYIVNNFAPNPVLDKLCYVDGASWDSMRVCLPDTRMALLQEVWAWAIAADARQIFWFTGVAGWGKSAFAHTIAQIFHTEKLLGSSFFFDRNVADRNTPRRLFGIIVRDLSRFNPTFAPDVVAILEEDPALASASMSRQFASLILGPLARRPLDRPTVIIIDAMDEISGDDLYDLLTILRDEVPKLPPTIRIFITSRPTTTLDNFLQGQEHIVAREIDIHSPENLQDIKTYICSRLPEIARCTKMREGWPDHSLFEEFRRAADGLFIWVSTVCNYLRTTYDPDRELRSLISNRSPQGLPPNRKMDELYIAILSVCHWHEPAFASDYGLVMGAIMAAKRPLSIAAWQAFHGDSLTRPVDVLLKGLSSLITGTADTSQPVHILHQSFRDFITHRAGECGNTMKFYVSEKEHSRRLALLCLRVINLELLDTIPGTGYLKADADEIPGIPRVSGVSEQLWYSCESWAAHLEDVASPVTVTDAMIGEISEAVSTRLTLWLEVVAAKGYFQGSLGVRAWLQRMAPKIFALHYDNENQGAALLKLSSRLSYDDRREEALTAVEESVELRRTLAAEQPANFTADLAMSLINFSRGLTALGRREEALRAIQEAVQIHRTLAAEQPAKFTPNLAKSLNILSIRLPDLDRREDALKAIEEAVELRRELAAEQPATFNHDLACSLNNLSLHLSDLGRREEGLKAIEEAVELHRKLAKERPAPPNPDHAKSLNNLANCLSSLGHLQRARTASEEAVEYSRKLAAERPGTLNDLAMAIDNLSNRLSDLGHREDAVTVIEEAVELRRKLAKKRPEMFNNYLATSLNNLSNRLFNLDRLEDALTAIEEAVTLRRKLAAERPAKFNPYLADSLHNLSLYLSKLGRQENALTAVEEAIELHRKLAAARPAIFNSKLAKSLNTLSSCLSDLGHPDEALVASEEARQLA